jgi:hypothetical protein
LNQHVVENWLVGKWPFSPSDGMKVDVVNLTMKMFSLCFGG